MPFCGVTSHFEIEQLPITGNDGFEAEGRRITLFITVRDSVDKIANGAQGCFVIDAEKLDARVAQQARVGSGSSGPVTLAVQ